MKPDIEIECRAERTNRTSVLEPRVGRRPWCRVEVFEAVLPITGQCSQRQALAS